MSLFQKSVEKKYLGDLDKDLIDKRFAAYQAYFCDTDIQNNIRNSKEEQFQEVDLQKLGIKMTLSEQAEWMQYFNEQKQKAQALKSEIDKTDKEIDQLVYALYGLTEEEIKIVEESV